MLQALRIEEARAIAAAAERRGRDERAMVDHLGFGPPTPRRTAALPLAGGAAPQRHQPDAQAENQRIYEFDVQRGPGQPLSAVPERQKFVSRTET
jgi:hypothetical protein